MHRTMVNIPGARDTQNSEKEKHTNEQYPQGQTFKRKETKEKRKKINKISKSSLKIETSSIIFLMPVVMGSRTLFAPLEGV